MLHVMPLFAFLPASTSHALHCTGTSQAVQGNFGSFTCSFQFSAEPVQCCELTAASWAHKKS